MLQRLLKATHQTEAPESDDAARTDASDFASFDLASIDFAALKAGDGKATLLVSHGWGGGIGRFVTDAGEAFAKAGKRALLLRGGEVFGQFVLQSLSPANDETLELEWGEDPLPLAALLTALDIDHAHIHSLANMPGAYGAVLLEAFEAASIAFDMTLHDYSVFCPRMHLNAADGAYCGEPPLEGCERCIAINGSPFGRPTVAAWLEHHQAILRRARRMLVPHEDVGRRIARHFDGFSFEVVPHPEPEPRPVQRKIAVLILGTLVAHKGANTVLAVAEAAERLGLPLLFLILGGASDEAFESLPNVQMLGAYQEEALDRAIERARADLAWFPGTVPETWSYTLSAAIRHALLPVAFDIGAIAARIKADGRGVLLPLDLSRDAEALAQRLVQAGLQEARAAMTIHALPR